MSKVKKEEDKKKTLSFSIDPRVYEMWVKYCEENGIENYSDYIEKMIKNKINHNEIY
jgi:phage/plasmid-associated DNA primase